MRARFACPKKNWMRDNAERPGTNFAAWLPGLSFIPNSALRIPQSSNLLKYFTVHGFSPSSSPNKHAHCCIFAFHFRPRHRLYPGISPNRRKINPLQLKNAVKNREKR
jgi:hypothetical protein